MMIDNIRLHESPILGQTESKKCCRNNIPFFAQELPVPVIVSYSHRETLCISSAHAFTPQSGYVVAFCPRMG